MIQRKAQPDSATETVSSTSDLIRDSGQPLPKTERNFFETRFAQDFSGVRIHQDADTAQAVQARAFTYGNHIVFGRGEYQNGSQAGRQLLAHELTHVIQQGYAGTGSDIQRKPRIQRKAPEGDIFVNYVVVYLNAHYIDFHTSKGLRRYSLDFADEFPSGDYQASVVVKGNDVDFTLNTNKGEFGFAYNVEPGQDNPATFFKKQPGVVFTITDQPAPELKKPEQKEQTETETKDPNVTYLTLEEAMRRCQANDLPGVKTFPYRGTRFGAAPIMAHRDGEDIIVKQPVYVFADKDFKKQTKTLPLDTFVGGVRLKPNEIVRVHTYEPRWYHLNITGSTSGDIEEEFCMTGAQMLEMAARSERDTWFNIGLTVVDAATFFIPVGKVASFVGKPIVNFAGRTSRNLAVAAMLGLREAAPTAFAGIASRTGVVLIEQQAVGQTASRAVSQSVSHVLIEFGEQASKQTVGKLGTGTAANLGTQPLKEAVARTVTVTLVDAAGNKVVSTLTTPTGDPAVDQMINQAFNATFDQSASQAANQTANAAAQAVAPEIAAGFTQAEVTAFKRIMGKPLTQSDINVLGQVWDNAARQGDSALLNAGNSRALFDLQRNRFWRAVRNNPQARALLEDAGMVFSGGSGSAPYYMLNGRPIRMTIDHIIERQTAPQLALSSANLRFSFTRENTVVLRLLNQLDPFQ